MLFRSEVRRRTQSEPRFLAGRPRPAARRGLRGRSGCPGLPTAIRCLGSARERRSAAIDRTTQVINGRATIWPAMASVFHAPSAAASTISARTARGCRVRAHHIRRLHVSRQINQAVFEAHAAARAICRSGAQPNASLMRLATVIRVLTQFVLDRKMVWLNNSYFVRSRIDQGL